MTAKRRGDTRRVYHTGSRLATVASRGGRIYGRSAVELPRIGALAAAGPGRRVHPRSARVPKVMLEVGGKPLLTRNLELLRDALGIRRVFIIVGHLGERIREAYGDRSQLGAAPEYLQTRDVERGLWTARWVDAQSVRDPFAPLLRDELY